MSLNQQSVEICVATVTFGNTVLNKPIALPRVDELRQPKSVSLPINGHRLYVSCKMTRVPIKSADVLFLSLKKMISHESIYQFVLKDKQ